MSEKELEIIKILLIDDDEEDYILTRDLFVDAMAGRYKLDWASSYDEGLSVIKRREHHVCLVDYRLADRSGVELIREAWKSRVITPMILLTGYGSHAVDSAAMDAGATDYLVKDHTPTALLERTIRYAVELNSERTRAEEALGALAQRQSAIAEIGRLALKGGDLQDLFGEAVTLVAATLGIEFCKILELGPEGDAFTLRAGTGWREECAAGQTTVSAGLESEAGFTLHSNEPVVVEDLRTETRFTGSPMLRHHEIVSGMSVIIGGRENAYGILGAYTAEARNFGVDETNFLLAVANVLAEAVGRKNTETELKLSEARFRRVVESNVVGIFASDGSGEITEANDAFLKMVGYPREDLTAGRIRWKEMTPPEYCELDNKALQELAATGVCETYEKEYIRKDRTRISILISCATFEGQKASGVGFVLDISDRKRSEVAVLESRAWLEAIFEGSRDGIVVEENDLIVFANNSLVKLYGYGSREEMVGQHISKFRTTDDDQRLLEFTRRRLAGEDVPTMYEFTGVRKDSSLFDVEVSVSSFSGSGKSFIVSTLRDISERKQAEAEHASLLSQLKAEKTRLADIFTHAPAFIASLRGPEHVFELANAHFYDFIGGRRDAIGMSARNAFPEIEGQGFFELLDEVYATGVPFVGNEMPVAFTDGAGTERDLQYINFVYQPLKDAVGNVSGILCHGVDVTEQVLARHSLIEAEQQLRQSQKLESVGMLAGGIAHDFNNLLTVILGYADITLKSLDEINPLAKNIGEIKKAAQRAASLTRQLLAFSRKQVLQPKVLDLNSTIANVERMLSRLIGEDMELCILPGSDLGRVKVDPGQVEQVILNLLINARDAMPQGGKITIETANVYLNEEYAGRHVAVQPGWYAMLAVTDTGDGMDAEIQKSIFEPFFTTKEQGKGTGLGLSTVYGIVKQSSGHLSVYSEVGMGACFKVYLPLVDAPVMPSDHDLAHLEGTNCGKTILLAEDEVMVRTLARESLIMYGHTVLEAGNAAEALQLCKQHMGPIDLLLTDVVMPGMGGPELAEQLGKLRPDTQVLYMSGYTDQAIVHNGVLDSGVNFIGKPFTPASLVLKVNAVLQHQANGRPLLEESLANADNTTSDKDPK